MTRQASELSDIEAILFDKDGTLLDFHGTWLPRGRDILDKLCGDDGALKSRLLAKVGYDASNGRIMSGSILAAGTNMDVAQVWAPELARSAVELEAYINRELSTNDSHPSVPVDDLTPSLQKLHDMGYALGVATMDSEKGIEATLVPFSCLHLFSFLAGYDSGHGSKPGPGMVQGFCQAMNLQPHQVMVVGDNTHDLHMGLSAGAGVVVGVLTGTSASADLHEADYVLDSIADLPELLG